MRQVVSSIFIVQKILGEQRPAGGSPFRLSTHCMRVERPEGVLLYHTLTGELLLLSPEEEAALEGLPGPVPPALGELVTRWFLRPLEADDMALADQAREIAARITQKKEIALTRYTIFTTTDCNARCFYCYEADWKKSSMSDQTALDTAEYIAAHRGGKPVRLHWFGGEPLVNARAIDVITGSLRQDEVEFQSTMTSNGYLFDETLVKRAKDDWNLKQVQITLDGTEEVYNQRKSYVDHQGSPYRQVLRNIGLLLDAGIAVNVRLNIDNDNERNLYALVDQLAERFAGKRDFGVYLMVIYENAGAEPLSYTEEERRTYAQKLRSLQTYVEGKDIAIHTRLRRGVAANSCMADSGSSTTVTTDGRLGRCEACKDGNIWGSIYSDEVDRDVLQGWSEYRPHGEACKTCAIYPQCVRLKKCPEWLDHCTVMEQWYLEDRLRRAIVCAYEDWKAAGQN